LDFFKRVLLVYKEIRSFSIKGSVFGKEIFGIEDNYVEYDEPSINIDRESLPVKRLFINGSYS
jgi:hypothetical protein